MKGTEIWRTVVNGKAVALRGYWRFKTDNASALLATALADLNVAALPDFLIDQHVATGAFPPRKVHELIES